MKVVVFGNLSEGFSFVGPFKDFDDACLFAEGAPDAWVATMESPPSSWAQASFPNDNNEEAKCGSNKCCEGVDCNDK